MANIFPPPPVTGGSNVVVSATEPVSAVAGDMWFDVTNQSMKVYADGVFMPVSAAHSDWSLAH